MGSLLRTLAFATRGGSGGRAPAPARRSPGRPARRLAAAGDEVLDLAQVPAPQGPELDAPGDLPDVGQAEDGPPGAAQQVGDLPGTDEPAGGLFRGRGVAGHAAPPLRRSMAARAAATRATSSSAKTRQLPARPHGRMRRERRTYSTRWTGRPSRRAISPTVGTVGVGAGTLHLLQGGRLPGAACTVLGSPPERGRKV